MKLTRREWIRSLQKRIIKAIAQFQILELLLHNVARHITDQRVIAFLQNAPNEQINIEHRLVQSPQQFDVLRGEMTFQTAPILHLFAGGVGEVHVERLQSVIAIAMQIDREQIGAHALRVCEQLAANLKKGIGVIFRWGSMP